MTTLEALKTARNRLQFYGIDIWGTGSGENRCLLSAIPESTPEEWQEYYQVLLYVAGTTSLWQWMCTHPHEEHIKLLNRAIKEVEALGAL